MIITQFVQNNTQYYAFRFQTGGVYTISDSNVELICQAVRDAYKARGSAVSKRIHCIRLIKLAFPEMGLADAKLLSESRLFDGAFI